MHWSYGPSCQGSAVSMFLTRHVMSGLDLICTWRSIARLSCSGVSVTMITEALWPWSLIGEGASSERDAKSDHV